MKRKAQAKNNSPDSQEPTFAFLVAAERSEAALCSLWLRMNIESQRRYRTYLLVLVYLIVLMEGIAFGASTSGMTREKGILYSFVLGLVLTQACIVDSRIAGRPLPLSSYWLVFILYGIAVPICVVRARGLRGLGHVAAHFVGMVLVFIISFIVTGLLFGTI